MSAVQEAGTGEFIYSERPIGEVLEQFYSYVRGLHQRFIREHFGQGNFTKLFESTKTVSGVLLHCSTTAGVSEGAARFPLLLRSLGYLNEQPLDAESMAMGELLNQVLHDRLGTATAGPAP